MVKNISSNIGKTLSNPIVAGMIIIVAILGLTWFYQSNIKSNVQPITTFEECVEAGNPVMESFPRQCRTEAGVLFVEEIDEAEQDNSDNQSDDSDADNEQPGNQDEAVEGNDNQYKSKKGVEITVTTPLENAIITSPLNVEGVAPGNWSFEADFPLKIYDSSNKLLGQGYATMQGDWMTEDDVKFKGSVKFDVPQTSTGFLVLEKSNPSGLEANDDSVTIPIRFK